MALKSYYPESDLKSNKEQRKDLKVWAKKYHEYNEFYTLYGFDLQGEGKQDDYIDYLGFMNTRNKVN